jgi:hypothetical protein
LDRGIDHKKQVVVALFTNVSQKSLYFYLHIMLINLEVIPI